jgi:anti-sigma-K factor RskA
MNAMPHDPAHLAPAEREALEGTLAAYALDALPPQEQAAVRTHLPHCAFCRHTVARLHAAADLLALAAEPVAPPPALRDRLLAAVAAEAAPRPVPSSRPPLSAEPGAPARLFGWWLATAALLLVALGLGIVAAALQQRTVRLEQELAQQARRIAQYEETARAVPLAGAAAPQASGLLFVGPSAAPPLLVLRDLPPLPADRAYQVWYIRDSQPISVDVLPPGASGHQVVALPLPPDAAQQVAVSVEPAGGSPAPTGPIVLLGRF